MKHNTLHMAPLAKPCATDQPPDDVADNEWTKDQLRLLHQTLTQKLRLADTCSEIMARAGSDTAVLQVIFSGKPLPVSTCQSQCSGSSLHHTGDKAACNDANELAVSKPDSVAAHTAANGDTTSLNTASMSSSLQNSAAHSTGCTSAGEHRTQPSAGKSSRTATQHRNGTSLSSGQHHTRQRSDKPARSHHRHKSSRRNRSPERSRRQTADHSTRCTGQSSPARRHLRASSRLKGSISKHAGSIASPARRTKALASTSQSPGKLSLFAASHISFSRPRSQKRNSYHSRLYARRHRSPSGHGTPRTGSRAREFDPANFADTSCKGRQCHAEAGAAHSDRWRSHPVLPDDPERHFPSSPLPLWHSQPGPGRTSAAVPPYSHNGLQPPPWSFPFPPRSWDDLRGRRMRVEPYSPPRRFNMGFTPRKPQSAGHADEMRPHHWSSPRDRVTSPIKRMPSPRSYFPGLGDQMSSPKDSLPSPNNSMPRQRGVTLRHRRSRWDRSLSPKDGLFSPRDRSLSPRNHSLSPRGRSLSPRDYSLSPRDRSSNPRDTSSTPMSNTCVIDMIRRQDIAHTSIQEDDHLHMARAAVIRPMRALPGPVPDSPAYAQLDLPGQNSPHGQHNSCLSGSCQPATTSPSCHLPSPPADGAVQQGSQALVHDAQMPSRLAHAEAHAAPHTEQVELHPHSPVARRRLDMNTADTAAQEAVPTDSSNTNSDSTTALCQTALKGSFSLPDSYDVVSGASESPLTQLHDGPGAAATRRQRPRQSDSSLLKKVLRKSLAKQNDDSKGLSGSEPASCNSSQDVFQIRSESAKAADAWQPQHAQPAEQADVRESKRAKGPQPADPSGDSWKQAHEQVSFQDDRASRKSKRRRHSSGAANPGRQTAVSDQPHAAAVPANSWTNDIVSADQQWQATDDKQTWGEALGSEGPLELDAPCWFYLDPSGKARGQYSLHMFMSWLHNPEKDKFEQELAAFRETTVWRANMTTRVPLMALLHHFETLHAASWEQTTA